MSKVIQFEPFKNSKAWDDEYVKFLGNTERFFGSKTDPQLMMKRLYFAMRYLHGVIRSFMIFGLLGIEHSELKRGIKFIVDWLEVMKGDLMNDYNG